MWTPSLRLQDWQQLRRRKIASGAHFRATDIILATSLSLAQPSPESFRSKPVIVLGETKSCHMTLLTVSNCRAAPRHFQRAKPEGNPKEKPCFRGRLQTCPYVSLSTQGTARGKFFQPTLEEFSRVIRLLIIHISCHNTWRNSS